MCVREQDFELSAWVCVSKRKVPCPIKFKLFNAGSPSFILRNIKSSNPASNGSSEHGGSCRRWWHENDSKMTQSSSKCKDTLALIPLVYLIDCIYFKCGN